MGPEYFGAYGIWIFPILMPIIMLVVILTILLQGVHGKIRGPHCQDISVPLQQKRFKAKIGLTRLASSGL